MRNSLGNVRSAGDRRDRQEAAMVRCGNLMLRHPLPPLPLNRSSGVRSMDKTHIEDRTAGMAGEIKATVGTLAGGARTRVEELAGQATETAEHVYGQARDQVRGAATSAAGYVEKQPLVALLAVGIVCGVAGFLLARR
jgi:uncharacterized protein YjbJ (UPF0337 family)